MVKEVTPRKRRFKNPETFRDKLNQQNKLPKVKKKKASKLFGKIFWLLSFLKKEILKLKKYLIFRIIFKVLEILSLIIYPRYIRNSFAELKGVTWPNFRLSLKLTYAVVIFAIIFGVSVALLDYGLGKIFKFILLK